VKIKGSNTVNSESKPVFDIIGMAASADGLKALRTILATLPSNFPIPIVVVKHLAAQYPSYLATILKSSTSLTVKQAEDGEELYPSTVYIAPPDYHLLVNANGGLYLSQSAKVHFSRPSADVLFLSVAEHYKNRAIAVVLTGGDSDGSAGVKAIKQMGGVVIAQDEATSTVFGMPAAAIKTGCVDFILPLDKISTAIINLVMTGELE
jgi:two-component system, chemotaxis family, protein-glutamate methylesterase/glutaminase